MPLKKARGRPTRYPADYQHPPCPACQRPVERHDGEPMHAWVGRRCCSVRCGGSMSALPQREAARDRAAEAEKEHGPCTICNGPVLKRRKETIERFKTRRTCSDKSCQKQWHAHCASAAGKVRAGTSQPHGLADVAIQLEPPGISFGDNFGRYDVPEKLSYGKPLIGMPPNQTYAGVVSYGR